MVIDLDRTSLSLTSVRLCIPQHKKGSRYGED